MQQVPRGTDFFDEKIFLSQLQIILLGYWLLVFCCKLFHIISGKKRLMCSFLLQPRERGNMRFHFLQNVQMALEFLKFKGVSCDVFVY